LDHSVLLAVNGGGGVLVMTPLRAYTVLASECHLPARRSSGNLMLASDTCRRPLTMYWP